jgi:hypothetical protein
MLGKRAWSTAEWKNVIMAEKAMRSHLTVLLEELKNLQQNRILYILVIKIITTMPVINSRVRGYSSSLALEPPRGKPSAAER